MNASVHLEILLDVLTIHDEVKCICCLYCTKVYMNMTERKLSHVNNIFTFNLYFCSTHLLNILFVNNTLHFRFIIQKFPIILRNLEKCSECLQRFHVEWQGKSSRKGISLILNRLIQY
jgi:hypothetical protein